jgi:flagellin
MATGDFTRINTNIGALNALNSLKDVQGQLGTHQLRLATGKRINDASDDPAGLTIATKFQYRASGLGTALDNIGDAKNMMSVAEGGLSKIKDILIKMRDKSVSASSDTLGTAERTAIGAQLTQFKSEIDNIVGNTKWNSLQLLNGLTGFASSTVNFQVGADNDTNDVIKLQGANFTATDTSTLGLTNIAVGSFASATAAITSLDTAIASVSSNLQTVGSLVSRMTYREETLTTAKVNTEAAYNRIMNADMAYEQLEATKMQILQQTSTAMLSQANQAPQGILSLFR